MSPCLPYSVLHFLVFRNKEKKDVSRPSPRLVPLPQSSLSATFLRASKRSESLRIKSSVCPSSTPLRNQLRLELKLSRTRCSSVSRSLRRDAFASQGHQCQQRRKDVRTCACTCEGYEFVCVHHGLDPFDVPQGFSQQLNFIPLRLQSGVHRCDIDILS